MKALVATVVLCLSVRVAQAATVLWMEGFDAGDEVTSAALFRGGVDETYPPTLGATVFPGTGNRKQLNIAAPAAASPGAQSYGVVTFAAQTDVTALAYLRTPAGYTQMPRSRCSGTSTPCISNFNCPADSYCQAQRRPILAFKDDAGNRGCILTGQLECLGLGTGGGCATPTITLYALYGSLQQDHGQCTASKSMDDSTVCGGSCTDVTDCFQGRPTAPGTSPYRTRCVRDGGTEAVECDTGMTCHCVNECDENNIAESDCSLDAAGIMIGLDPNTTYVVGVRQKNGAQVGDVQCGLYVGSLADGTNEPLVYRRGERTFRVGQCTGGSDYDQGGHEGLACASNADCACGLGAYESCTAAGLPRADCTGVCVAGSCDATTLAHRIAPTRLVIGPDDSSEAGSTQAMTLAFDNIAVMTGDPITNYVIESVWADQSNTQTWGATGCASANVQCFAGGSSNGWASEPDGTTTHLENVNTYNTTEVWNFATVTQTSYTPVAAAINVLGLDKETASACGGNCNRGIIAQLEASDAGANTTIDYNPSNFDCPAESGDPACPGFDFDEFVDQGAAAGSFELIPPRVLPTIPGGGEWSFAKLNTVRAHLSNTGSHGSIATARGGVTFSDLEVMLQTPDSPVPNVLQDQNSDNLTTVGYIGDSTWNELWLKAYLGAYLYEPDNLYEQARGAAAMGDVSLAFSQLIQGKAGPGETEGPLDPPMTTEVVFGETQHLVDYAFVNIGINTLSAWPVRSNNPTALFPTTVNPAGEDMYGIGQAGYCEQWSAGGGYGSQQGKACTCDAASNWTGGIYYGSLGFVKATGFATTTLQWCSANADCSLGGMSPPDSVTTSTCGRCVGGRNEGAACTVASQCSGGGTCALMCWGDASNVRANALATTTGNWWATGCSDSPGCPGGVCMAGTDPARMLREVGVMQAVAEASAAHPVMIWSTTPRASGDYWWTTERALRAWNTTLVAWARARGYNWIDLAGRFARDCGDAYRAHGVAVNECVRDGVHWTPRGHYVSGQLMVDCLTNSLEDGTSVGVTDGVCDTSPVCSSGTCQSGMRKGGSCASPNPTTCGYCTRGKIGNPCATNADCGYFYCDL